MSCSIRRWSLALALVGCGPSPGGNTGPGSSSGGEPTTSSSEATSRADGSSEVDSTVGTTAVDPSATASDSTTASTTGEPACVPFCYEYRQCLDGMDNDGDGLVDTQDPECVSPCHDDEASTYHGLPPDGGDCIRDCYFDDNRGSGDDLCQRRMICDPLGPAEYWGCSTLPDIPSCMDLDLQDPECIDTCLPLTPPGCDCYGCCTMQTPSGPQDRWLEHPDCTVADPSACPPCTQSTTCVNLCDDPCEWCFGEPAPPPGCPAVTCEQGTPCTDHCDCEDGLACMQGCCRPGTFFLR